MNEESANIADVSVIVPAFRAAATIARMLDSVAAQTLRPREVIVVDDGSDDGTLAAIEACRDGIGDIELKVFSQKNLGPGAARNRALAEATSEIVAFLDSDDEWMPEKLERSLAVMAETGSDLVSHDYLSIGPDGERVVQCARHFRAARDPFVAQYLRGYIAASGVVVKRARVTQAGGFDADIPAGQDFDLWLAITGRRDVRFHIFDDVLMRYHVMPGSITSRVDERRRGGVKILLRHAPSLKGRGGGVLATALLRAVIVHMQAASAHMAYHKPLAALSSLALTPLTLMGVIGSLYGAPLLWSWVAVMTGLYGWQFREYIDPILKVTGLK
ncbi:MAG: glycosyltransferase family 2 protein [Alphaproteobacteria bacterium]